MDLSYTPGAGAAAPGAARVLRRPDDAGVRAAPGHGEGDYGERARRTGRSSGSSGGDGWLALSWPEEYGGRGGSMLDQLIFTDEAAIAGVPVPFLTINTVGPDDHAVRHRRAEGASTCRGSRRARSTSPSATPSPRPAPTWPRLRTTARSGTATSYVINGQKMWTSLIQYADYVWLACRTDPRPPRHKGLSDHHRADQRTTASPGPRCTPWPGVTHQRHLLLRRSGCPSPPWSARRMRAGR